MNHIKPIIALDCDGVLLDYNLAFARRWGQFTGTYPEEIDPLAYWHTERWNITRLTGERLVHWQSFLNREEFWSTLPPLPGAVSACESLRENGYQLVCVTALQDRFAAARQKNLLDHGFHITTIYTAGNEVSQDGPKKKILHTLNPVAFVDDYLPYLEGLDESIHTALILREPNGSPNARPDFNSVKSRHKTLVDFATWWLSLEKNCRQLCKRKGNY